METTISTFRLLNTLFTVGAQLRENKEAEIALHAVLVHRDEDIDAALELYVPEGAEMALHRAETLQAMTPEEQQEERDDGDPWGDPDWVTWEFHRCHENLKNIVAVGTALLKRERLSKRGYLKLQLTEFARMCVEVDWRHSPLRREE